MASFFEKPAGKVVTGVGLVVAVGLLIWSVSSNMNPSGGSLSRDRMFVDAKTNQPFEYTLKAGDALPVAAPSGGKTGYPSEQCYWTKDGKTKKEPTYVILNEQLGKDGPTFCPDCGRLVVGHNPPPDQRPTPPPTEAEYGRRRGGS